MPWSISRRARSRSRGRQFLKPEYLCKVTESRCYNRDRFIRLLSFRNSRGRWLISIRTSLSAT